MSTRKMMTFFLFIYSGWGGGGKIKFFHRTVFAFQCSLNWTIELSFYVLLIPFLLFSLFFFFVSITKIQFRLKCFVSNIFFDLYFKFWFVVNFSGFFFINKCFQKKHSRLIITQNCCERYSIQLISTGIGKQNYYWKISHQFVDINGKDFFPTIISKTYKM